MRADPGFRDWPDGWGKGLLAECVEVHRTGVSCGVAGVLEGEVSGG